MTGLKATAVDEGEGEGRRGQAGRIEFKRPREQQNPDLASVPAELRPVQSQHRRIRSLLSLTSDRSPPTPHPTLRQLLVDGQNARSLFLFERCVVQPSTIESRMEDPAEIAAVCQEYVASLDNVPHEVTHILKEIQHKDAKVQVRTKSELQTSTNLELQTD